MHEPHVSPETAVFGVKVASLVAGFAGAIISLSFLRELTKTQAAMAVLTGTVSTGYLTPLISLYIPATIPELSLSFLVGLTAMNVIPGILKLSELFKKNPASFIGKGGDQK